MQQHPPPLPAIAPPWLSILATLSLASVGGVVAATLKWPLPWMLGSLLFCALYALFGKKPLGISMAVPKITRNIAVPIIGLAIGAGFSPAVLREIPSWGLSLALLCFYLPLAHVTAWWVLRLGGVERITAWFGAVPGGLIESVTLGEEANCDVALLILLQFLRLIVTITAVPIILALLTGQEISSDLPDLGGAAGAVLSPLDWLLFALIAAVGLYGGRFLRLPAYVITGPVLASGIAHLTGLVHGAPPSWLIAVMQLLIGASLGAQFSGMSLPTLRKGIILAGAATGSMLALSAAFALVLGNWGGQNVAAVFLAFSPGGIAEMSLIALSLNISAVYVTFHHVIRLLMSVAIARYVGRRLQR